MNFGKRGRTLHHPCARASAGTGPGPSGCELVSIVTVTSYTTPFELGRGAAHRHVRCPSSAAEFSPLSPEEPVR
jgi:hypothetical protein